MLGAIVTGNRETLNPPFTRFIISRVMGDAAARVLQWNCGTCPVVSFATYDRSMHKW